MSIYEIIKHRDPFGVAGELHHLAVTILKIHTISHLITIDTTDDHDTV